MLKGNCPVGKYEVENKWHPAVRQTADQDQSFLENVGFGEWVFDACSQGGHSCSLNPSLCPCCHGPTAAHGVDSSDDGRCCHLSPVVYYKPSIPTSERETSACFWQSGILSICLGQHARTLPHWPWRVRETVVGSEDTGARGRTWGHHVSVFRAHLPVPKILAVLQAHGSAFSHFSPTSFALQVLLVGVESEVTEPEGKGNIQSLSLEM